MKEFKFSKYHVVTENIGNEEKPKRLLYSTKTNEVIIINNLLYKNLINNNFSKLSRAELMKLLDMRLIIPIKEKEINEILKENKVLVSNNKVLYHVIQPTANCQLGCNYCGQIHTQNKLSPEMYTSIIERIEEKIILNKNYKALSVTWYGAEPLLGLKQIKDLTPKLIQLASKYNLKYSHDMITNGLLLKEKVFKELVNDYNIESFQITIDGLGEYHDKRRMTKKNNPTFNVIMSNIKMMVSHPSYKKNMIGLRINIDTTNQSSVIPLLDYLEEVNVLDKLVISFSPIVDWGGNNASKDSLTNELFAIKEIDWKLELIKRNSQVNGLIPERTGATCMVETKDAEVFDAFGNIYACYEMPYTPLFNNENYIEGNIKNKDNHKKNSLLRNWSKYVKEGTDNNCAECKYYPVCGGGCPKTWLIEKKSSCPSFKYNMEDRLVLQYLINKSDVKSLI